MERLQALLEHTGDVGAQGVGGRELISSQTGAAGTRT